MFRLDDRNMIEFRVATGWDVREKNRTNKVVHSETRFPL